MGKFYRYVNKKLVSVDGIGVLKDANGNLVYENEAKANLLVEYFCSVFSEDNGTVPAVNRRAPDGASLGCVYFTASSVLKYIRKLKSHTSPGPDGISADLLKKLEFAVSGPLAALFETLFINRYVPVDWKLAAITPIYKKGEHCSPQTIGPFH